jgi:hypothetical protein
MQNRPEGVHARLDDQITWYDARSEQNQHWFRRLKVAQLVAAAAVPVVAGVSAEAWIVGSLGAGIVVMEGLQQLFQFQQNWTSYRATCEALRHEKFLFEARAGPYAVAQRPEAVLAERIEGLVSQEHAKWVSSQEESAQSGAEVGD